MLMIRYAKSAVEPSKTYFGEIEKQDENRVTVRLADTVKPEYRTFKRQQIMSMEVCK